MNKKYRKFYCWTQKRSYAVQTVPTLRQQKNQHFRQIWLRGAKN